MKRSIRGFTLIETILTVVMLSILATVVAWVLTVGLDIYAFVVNRHAASQTASVAFHRLQDDLMTLHPYDIISMSDQRLTFIDRDGFITDFHLSSVAGVPVLYRGSRYLVEHVDDFDFDFLRANGTPASFPSQVQRIGIDLTVSSEANAGQMHFRTEIVPRGVLYDDFE